MDIQWLGNQGWICSGLILLSLLVMTRFGSSQEFPERPIPNLWMFPSLFLEAKFRSATSSSGGSQPKGVFPTFLHSPAPQRRRSATCSSSARPAGSWHPGHHPLSPPGRIKLEKGMQEGQEEPKMGKKSEFERVKAPPASHHCHRIIPRQNFQGIPFKNNPGRGARASLEGVRDELSPEMNHLELKIFFFFFLIYNLAKSGWIVPDVWEK